MSVRAASLAVGVPIAVEEDVIVRRVKVYAGNEDPEGLLPRVSMQEQLHTVRISIVECIPSMFMTGSTTMRFVVDGIAIDSQAEMHWRVQDAFPDLETSLRLDIKLDHRLSSSASLSGRSSFTPLSTDVERESASMGAPRGGSLDRFAAHGSSSPGGEGTTLGMPPNLFLYPPNLLMPALRDKVYYSSPLALNEEREVVQEALRCGHDFLNPLHLRVWATVRKATEVQRVTELDKRLYAQWRTEFSAQQGGDGGSTASPAPLQHSRSLVSASSMPSGAAAHAAPLSARPHQRGEGGAPPGPGDI